MTQSYRTVQGDVLDRIVWKHYGAQLGALEFVMSENPHLRDEDAVLAPNQIVRLPIFETQETTSRVRLWT